MPHSREPEQREVDIAELEEQFKDFVYAQNGKITNERLALLRTLYIHDGHFSIDEILDLLEEQGLGVSRATVYRTLDLLVQSGLVKKLTIQSQETRYESALTSGHHDHIICVECNKIFEFFSPELERIQDGIMAQHGFKMAWHVHQLYGHCARENCPEKEKVTSGKKLVSPVS